MSDNKNNIKKMIKTIDKIDKEFEDFYGIISKDYDKANIRKAYECSKKAHNTQSRDTGEPYIIHPLYVARTVFDLGLDSESIIAALLHDVVEDTEMNIEFITKEFGSQVALIVDGLTKITGFSRNKKDEKIEALRKVLLASAKDIRILIIKLADRLHNMRTIHDLPEDKRDRVSQETMLIYVPIAQKIGLYSIKWELEDLSFKYTNRDMYQFIKEKINMKRAEREAVLDKAVSEIKKVLDDGKIKYSSVLGRPKNFYSIYKKIKDSARTFEEIHDLYAIRVNLDSVEKCYSILGYIHEKFQVFPDRFKDYISNPKLNGYQSIHTVIYSKAISSPIEIQIRTEEMHKLAEFGIAAHWRYKSLKQDKKFEKKISWLREVMLWEKEHKDNEEFLQLLKFDFFEDEIFVFTPKNDVIVLPEMATVLDFAYAVHTNIGETAIRGKVNGAVCTLDKILKSGDIVEVLTSNNSKPNEKWLKFVKTNKARIKIRQVLNLKKSNTSNVEAVVPSFSVLSEKIVNLSSYKKSRKGKCCNFEYGDSIVGVINKDKELVIHNSACDNAKFTINEKVNLKWKTAKRKEITINLLLEDKIGLLMDILNIFAKNNLNIEGVTSKNLRNGDTDMSIVVKDEPQVDNVVMRLKEMSFVKHVKLKKSFFNYS